MSATLAVNVWRSIHKLPLKEASCEGWGAQYAARPAMRIVAFDKDTWLGEFVSRKRRLHQQRRAWQPSLFRSGRHGRGGTDLLRRDAVRPRPASVQEARVSTTRAQRDPV